MRNEEIFKLGNSIAHNFILGYDYPWEVLPNIKEYILSLGQTLKEGYTKIGEDIWIANTAKVSELSTIIGPTIICDNVTVRPGAFIRGSVIVGDNSVVGNSSELKNCILYNNVEVPHFNYVGDSILGYKSHLGAGVILSNLRSDKKNIIINNVETNLRKIGSFLGDYVEIGCNSVLNPGTIIKEYSMVYPLTSVKGIIEERKIVKSMDNIVDRKDV